MAVLHGELAYAIKFSGFAAGVIDKIDFISTDP